MRAPSKGSRIAKFKPPKAVAKIARNKRLGGAKSLKSSNARDYQKDALKDVEGKSDIGLYGIGLPDETGDYS